MRLYRFRLYHIEKTEFITVLIETIAEKVILTVHV